MSNVSETIERHVMVDIETLSTSSNAFITSIAAIEFFVGDDTGKPRATFKRIFDPWQAQQGAEVDGATVMWRQNQSEESKIDLCQPASNFNDMPTSLDELREFIGDSIVWANAPDFDLVILNNAAKRYGLKPITKYYQHRCVRTAKMVLEAITNEKVMYKSTHDPIQDCIDQAHRIVYPLLNHLNEIRDTRCA